MMERSGNSRPSLPIFTYGLSVVFDPGQSSLDIVFVHGFTGHPERTWTHKKGDMRLHTNNGIESAEPPLKKHKRNLFFESREKEIHTPTYWPRDLVPLVIPTARVLTYGYDTHIRHKLGPREHEHTIYDIAWDFLIALEAERRGKSSRPIYFIVHSLGGIVVKEMLRRSSDTYQDQTYLRSIFNSTIGVMFFGTPHNGADPRGMIQLCAEKICKAAGFSVDQQVFNALLPRSERLQELRDTFGPRAQHQNWIIHSFQEELGKASLGNRKVVDDTSSCLNIPAIEIKEHIRRDHTDMCRFTGPEDVEFRKVASALRKISDSVFSPPLREEKPRFSEEDMRSLKESLWFEQINTRRWTIKKAHAKTCRWLLEKTEYLDWLNPMKLSEHHGFLWIKGKPGTGKSTLMKFVLNHARNMMTDWVIISFFFNARGENLEKSTLGAYQSLLLQLLERLPILDSVLNTLDLPQKGDGVHYQWNTGLLKELFERAILSLEGSSTVCFIDALDECNESQIRDMISFFERIGDLAVSAGIRFQVCLSSRHYPHITIEKGLNLVLEGQEGHTHDIVNYLESELKIGRSKIAEQTRTELEEKAAGVFMWVVLVVEILKKEYDSGRIHALRQRLREIPSDLHELFRDILTRDSHNRDELILCIQWILFAKRPLRPEELYFGVLSGVESQPLSRWDPDEISIHDIERFVLDSSKGLAEITKSKTSKVQFIHESVNDFLLHENGLGRIGFEFEGNFQGQSHERLKQCCIHYMKADGVASLDLGKDPPKASSQEGSFLRESATKTFPFLEYVIGQVLYHADAAQGYNVSQTTFISNFQLVDWIRLDNLLAIHQVRRHTPDASLLYILAECNMSNLIQSNPSLVSFIILEKERYGLPLFAALATKSQSAIHMFFKACAAKQSLGDHFDELCNQYNQEGRRPCSIGRDFSYSKRRNVLSYLAEFGDEVLFAIVLATKTIPPNCKHANGPTPLWIAASKGNKAMVKMLLDTGEVKLNPKGPFNARTHNSIGFNRYTSEWPLWHAVVNSDEATVKFLLNIDEIEVDPIDNVGRTPLWWAVNNRNEATVKMLLDTGKVDVNLKDAWGQTPIGSLLYISSDHKYDAAVAKILFNTGKVDVNIKDNSGQTLLSRVATDRHGAEVLKPLLESGKVKIDSNNDQGQTLLWLAANSGNQATVKLLLDTGKFEVDAKDDGGVTPLNAAARSSAFFGNIAATVKLLLDTGQVEVDSKDIDGRTPLSHAALRNYAAASKLLLGTGKVDVNSKDKNGMTPLRCAISGGSVATVKLLLDTGQVEVDSKDIEGRTPLHLVAFRGNEAIVKLLLDTGKVQVDPKANDGRTPLWWAVATKQEAIVKLLLDTGKINVDLKSLEDNDGITPQDYIQRMARSCR